MTSRRTMRKGFDVVGDIAIIRDVAPEAESSLAESILRNNRRLSVVLAQSGPVQGTFRLRQLRWVAGEKRTFSVHRENGCTFHVDLATTHFSPSLVHERGLVSEDIGEGEIVLNMFGGVGTFSVEIAQKNPTSKVYNVDINPDAIRLCLRNVLINRLRGKVVGILADAEDVVDEAFRGRSDRVLLPLPEKSCECLSAAVSALKCRGFIQYYDFVDADRRESPLTKALDRIDPFIRQVGVSFDGGRIVKSVAPRRYLVSLKLHKGSGVASSNPDQGFGQPPRSLH